MKSAFFCCSLLLLSAESHALAPIDGWYASAFGGFAYLPSNVSVTHDGFKYTNAIHRPGYDAGGNIGYKSNPLRYEGELYYFNANNKEFDQNSIKQPTTGGYNNGALAMADVYYDFPGLIPCLEPFLGIGIGYIWINEKLDNLQPVGLTPSTPSTLRIATSAFAYQASGGITYNFAENYSLYMTYRYLGTPHVFDLGHMFQAHFGNIGVTYRFDDAKYK